MKKLFSSVFLVFMAFVLTACTVPARNTAERKNGLNCAFSADVSIELDKLNATGKIRRSGEGEWDIEFLSPDTLGGVVLAFSSGTVTASYKGLSFSVPRTALPVKAMMLNLIDAVDSSARTEQLSGEEKDGMLQLKGSLEGGEYTITVDSEGRLSAFEMPNNLLKMTFSELTVTVADSTAGEQPVSTAAANEPA